jgi:hypothetical protein
MVTLRIQRGPVVPGGRTASSPRRSDPSLSMSHLSVDPIRTVSRPNVITHRDHRPPTRHNNEPRPRPVIVARLPPSLESRATTRTRNEPRRSLIAPALSFIACYVAVTVMGLVFLPHQPTHQEAHDRRAGPGQLAEPARRTGRLRLRSPLDLLPLDPTAPTRPDTLSRSRTAGPDSNRCLTQRVRWRHERGLSGIAAGSR